MNLLDLPKRPKSVFAMFAQKHKDEVPQGKGEGKGRSALKAKFMEISTEEKEALEKQEQERLAKFKQDLAEFKESDKFKCYVTAKKKIKLEFLNEAMKVLTLKFLTHSPASPPKTAFAVYLHEKRKSVAEAGGMPKSKKETAEEKNAFREHFRALDEATKKEYGNTRVEMHKAWQAEVKEYMGKPMWQDYLKEARRLKVPIKSLLTAKKIVVKRLKNGIRYIPMPEKPPDYPQKPPTAYSLFCANRKGMMELSDMQGGWEKLEAEEKTKFLDEAASLQKEYEIKMTLFKQSDKGRAYFKEAQATARRRRVTLAKFKYLKEQPKKPLDPKIAWMKAHMPEVKQEFPGLKGYEVQRKLNEKLQNLPQEERQKMEDERKKKQEDFSLSMKEFKESENYQKFCKMAKVQAKGKWAASEPIPDDMPRKPPDALRAFQKEHPDKPCSEVKKMFNELEQKEKQTRQQEAQAALNKYVADLAAWQKTEVERKYKN